MTDRHLAHDRLHRRSVILLTVVMASIVGLSAWDILADLRHAAGLRHVRTEAALLTLGLVGLSVLSAHHLRLSRRARDLKVAADDLSRKLEEAAAKAALWRAEARHLINGLSQAIDEQFDRWGLTPAEKEIALLLLKGLSHKEIATLRASGEATVRQQARSVYKKAKLGGRAELSAFFLEDLLVPREPQNQAKSSISR